jgi:hypothetical protein
MAVAAILTASPCLRATSRVSLWPVNFLLEKAVNPESAKDSVQHVVFDEPISSP